MAFSLTLLMPKLQGSHPNNILPFVLETVDRPPNYALHQNTSGCHSHCDVMSPRNFDSLFIFGAAANPFFDIREARITFLELVHDIERVPSKDST